MKATCRSNSYGSLTDHQLTFAESAIQPSYVEPLTIGGTYSVVGIMVVESPLFFLIRDDFGYPNLVHAGYFELFETVIPEGWKFSLERGIQTPKTTLRLEPGIATWGYPELIDDPNHYHRLVECDPAALAIFDSYIEASDSRS